MATSLKKDRRLYKVPEGAAYANLSVRTMWALIASGELRVVRIGRAVRIDKDDLDALIDRGKEERISTTG